MSFRPHHLFAWWWGALPPGYLDLYLVQYSHDVIISLFHRKASGRPYLFHFEKAARFVFSLTTSFVFTYCSSISHIAGCWSVASSKAQVVCLRGQSSWWQRGNWGKVKKCSSCRLHRRHPGQAQALQKPMPTVTLWNINEWHEITVLDITPVEFRRCDDFYLFWLC